MSAAYELVGGPYAGKTMILEFSPMPILEPVVAGISNIMSDDPVIEPRVVGYYHASPSTPGKALWFPS